MDGITAFIGMNGSGKTLALVVRLLVPTIDAGRPILSNTPLFYGRADAVCPGDECPCREIDPRGWAHWTVRRPHPLYVPLVSWRQLHPGIRRCTIALDEMSSMFDSRDSRSMPGQLVSMFQQLRKNDCLIGWTAPRWERCDSAIRGVTQGLYLCTGHRPQRVDDRMWRSNRVSRWRYYDAQAFDEFSLASATSQQKGTLRSEWRMKYRRERHEHQYLYDTFAPVNRLDHLDHSGMCIGCGGSRTRPRCHCEAGTTVGPVRPFLDLGGMKAEAREMIAARLEARPSERHLLPSDEDTPTDTETDSDTTEAIDPDD